MSVEAIQPAAPGSLLLDDEVERFIRVQLQEMRGSVLSDLEKGEERRSKSARNVLAVIGIVGVGVFGTLGNLVIKERVSTELEARGGQLTQSLDFIRFSNVVLKLDIDTSFSNDDRDAVMNYLRKAVELRTLRSSPEFRSALSKVVRSFVSAGLTSQIDEILQMFPAETRGNNETIESLMHHFGQLLAAREVTPRLDPQMDNFEQLEAAAAGAKIPELAYLYRALIEHRKQPGKTQDAVERQLARVAQLDLADAGNFYMQLLQRTKAENWQRQVDPLGRALQALTRSFCATYASSLASLTSIPEPVWLGVARAGLDEEEVKPFALKAARGLRQSPVGS